MTQYPRCRTKKTKIVLITQTYCSKHKYKVHKHVNANMNLKPIPWNNNPHIYRGEYPK